MPADTAKASKFNAMDVELLTCNFPNLKKSYTRWMCCNNKCTSDKMPLLILLVTILINFERNTVCLLIVYSKVFMSLYATEWRLFIFGYAANFPTTATVECEQ